MSCSASVVARSLRPMYSTTTVPYWSTSYSLGLNRMLVRVDVVDLTPGRRVLVAVEPRPEALEVARLVEDQELRRRCQALQQLDGLVRERELLVGRQVPALVLRRSDR